MPFLPVTLKCLKPKDTDFEPKTLGERIQKKRLGLGLSQRQVADRPSVNAWTVLNWEKNHTRPPIEFMPGILQFLGSNPFPEPLSIPEHLLAKRRQMGWSIRDAARLLGVDPGTWGDWERGKRSFSVNIEDWWPNFSAYPYTRSTGK